MIKKLTSHGRSTTSFTHALRGKSVFVTGHTGFKGSWLCLWLNHIGASVTGYALAPPTNPNHFSISNVQETLADHHEADIRDLKTLTAAIQQAKPDVVLHLAAQTVVRKSYEIPLETFEINVMGTANVLEAVRTLGHPCSVVCVTSDKCYENQEQVWGYRECDAMGEHDPYGGSKGAAELVIRSYRHSFFDPNNIAKHGIKLASARAGNVIGGGDFTEDALIVDVFKSLAAGEPAKLRSPGALRPWQHVLQALSGYLTLAGKLIESDDSKLCSGWNFGPLPGNELPVSELVDIFLDQWGHGSWIDVSNSNNPHEANILRLSIDKALWQLNWTPGWSVQQSLSHTAQWYRRFLETPESMKDFSINQIDSYQSAFSLLPELQT
ncbi:MAG: CDP-glucose 4,6-dehydratase [Blastopirellula sp.]|nr:MAG: CDP-glucose 4,6-dehydratase [Blastopirellula sp.]